MKKYLLPILTSTLVLILISYASWSYIIKDRITRTDVLPENNELVFTAEEELAISQWKDKSGDELTSDALAGDSAGLWMVGMSFLTGNLGFTIDTKSADTFFAWSGSLGFAPALDQIRKMYQIDRQDLFLSLVYLNLTISEKHPELFKLYNKIKSQLIEDGGLKIVNEIEKIAAHKKSLIIEFKTKNKDFLKEVVLKKRSIVDEDVLFDMEFWADIISGKLNTGNLEEWLKDSNNYYKKIQRQAAKD